VTLAFNEDARQVGRVRRWRNGWEAHYDARGLKRPPLYRWACGPTMGTWSAGSRPLARLSGQLSGTTTDAAGPDVPGRRR
jgi:hypothetical protein